MSTPLALVYRGKAAKPAACSDAVAELLADSAHGFDVRFVGPKEDLGLTSDVLAGAALYAQPGGGELGPAYRRMRRYRDAIRAYVAGGGRYLGVCLGGYLAGRTPGFALLPGDTDQYVRTPDATVRTTDDTVVEVRWRGSHRHLFFQDGPVFRLGPDATGVDVLSRYPNGELAALVAPFGAGRVGVVGPHPEATPDWYGDLGLADPDPRHAELGHNLVDALMGGPAATAARPGGAGSRRIS
ncbi:BPL-N domain-containing protein [Pseudonocardia sp. DLS-67]